MRAVISKDNLVDTLLDAVRLNNGIPNPCDRAYEISRLTARSEIVLVVWASEELKTVGVRAVTGSDVFNSTVLHLVDDGIPREIEFEAIPVRDENEARQWLAMGRRMQLRVVK